MRLRADATDNPWLEGRLLLASRGVELTPESLAGASVEAETNILIRTVIKAWAKG